MYAGFRKVVEYLIRNPSHVCTFDSAIGGEIDLSACSCQSEEDKARASVARVLEAFPGRASIGADRENCDLRIRFGLQLRVGRDVIVIPCLAAADGRT